MVDPSPKDPAGAAARRKARLAREAELLDEGRADIRAGRSLSGEALDKWLEDLHPAQEAPATGRSRRRTSR